MRKFEQRNDGGLPRLVPFGHDAGTLFGIVEQLSLRERLQIAVVETSVDLQQEDVPVAGEMMLVRLEDKRAQGAQFVQFQVLPFFSLAHGDRKGLEISFHIARIK